MRFGKREFAFSDDDPPVIIGEIGVNHNGTFALARELIDVAVDASVHIVKLQVFKTEKEISRFAELAPYQKETASGAANQFDLCKALELSYRDVNSLKQHCDNRGIGFLCSTFDVESTDFLVNDLAVGSLKVASGEVTNLPFLEYVGGKGVGVLLSTGASTLEEVRESIRVLLGAGCPELVLLHCVSNYPAPDDELNLRAIQTLKEEFGLPVGFSDHSQGVGAAMVAVGLGARVIEKHFTIDRELEGPDHKASAEPDELRRLVRVTAQAHGMLGDGRKRPMPCEMPNLELIRRSLVAARALKAGTQLEREMIEIKRPASGIHPADLARLIGCELVRDVDEDEPLTWDCFNLATNRTA